jgi:hypothetical protein
MGTRSARTTRFRVVGAAQDTTIVEDRRVKL